MHFLGMKSFFFSTLYYYYYFFNFQFFFQCMGKSKKKKEKRRRKNQGKRKKRYSLRCLRTSHRFLVFCYCPKLVVNFVCVCKYIMSSYRPYLYLFDLSYLINYASKSVVWQDLLEYNVFSIQPVILFHSVNVLHTLIIRMVFSC